MTQDQAEVDELVRYLNNIKSYERDYVKSERITIKMIWGLFILIGGILDGYFSLVLNYSPHFIIWALVIGGAIFSQNFISNQPLLFEKEFVEDINRATISKFEIVIIVLIFAATVFIGFYEIALVIPFIGISFGTTNALEMMKNPRPANFRDLLVVSSFFVVAAIEIVLFLLIPSSFVFFGLIFGLLVGGSTMLSALLSSNERSSE